MNETGSAKVSSLAEQRGGEDDCRHRDHCQQCEIAGRARPTRDEPCRQDQARASVRAGKPRRRRGRRVRVVLAAMAVPAEHGDVSAALVSEPLVGAVVDRQPAA